MWPSNQPTDTASETASACVINIQADTNRELRAKVLRGLEQFNLNSVTYCKAAANDVLHTVKVEHFPYPGGLQSDEMERLYDNHLSRSKTALPIYSGLRLSGPDERCTYCASQTADSLDHFIPKKEYSALAIEPWNLVPCCTRCNRNLSRTWVTEASTRMFHPYFMPDLRRWLYAKIVNCADPYVVFRAEPDLSLLDAELCSRISAQFDALNLQETLGSIALQELRAIQHRLRTRFNSEAVAREHLQEQACELFELDKNSIRGVLYETAADDQTFIQNHLRSSAPDPSST